MIELTACCQDNILTIVFRGRVRPGDLDAKRAEFETALRALRSDFRVITDLAELEEMSWACADEIKHLMTRLSDAGVREVVRVIPDPSRDIGFAIMSIFHYPSKTVFQTFKSRAEASHALCGLVGCRG